MDIKYFDNLVTVNFVVDSKEFVISYINNCDTKTIDIVIRADGYMRYLFAYTYPIADMQSMSDKRFVDFIADFSSKYIEGRKHEFGLISKDIDYLKSTVKLNIGCLTFDEKENSVTCEFGINDKEMSLLFCAQENGILFYLKVDGTDINTLLGSIPYACGLSRDGFLSNQSKLILEDTFHSIINTGLDIFYQLSIVDVPKKDYSQLN